MRKSKPDNQMPFATDRELVSFFDDHDMGDYMKYMPQARFDVELSERTHLVAIEDDVMSKIAEIAETKHISTEALVDSWLREKINQSA